MRSLFALLAVTVGAWHSSAAPCAGHRICLRPGAVCRPGLAHRYASVGLECVSGRLRRKPAPNAPPLPVVPGAIGIRTPERGQFLSASGNLIWVQQHAESTVVAVNPATNRVVATAGPANHRVCDIDASVDGAVWLADCGLAVFPGTSGLQRLDSATGMAVATIDGPSSGGVLATPAAVWATGGTALSRIDPAANAIVATVELGPNPGQIAQAEGSVWVVGTGVGSGTSTLWRIDQTTNAVTASIPVGPSAPTGDPRSPLGATNIAAGGGYVWVTNEADHMLYRIDPATNTAMAFDVGISAALPSFSGAVVTYGLDSVWVLTAPCTVARIDPASMRTTKQYAVCTSPIEQSAGGIIVAFGSLWTTSPEQHALYRITP